MKLRFFQPSEFACPDCGQNDMQPEFMQQLDEARFMAKHPFVITSGYRCPKHNEAVGGSPTSSHLHGIAADIAATNSHARYVITQALMFTGFKRIGINAASGFIHADTDPDKPQRVLWGY